MKSDTSENGQIKRDDRENEQDVFKKSWEIKRTPAKEEKMDKLTEMMKLMLKKIIAI